MGDRLLEGEYNEHESHAGFLEALNAWRNTSKPGETPTQQKDKKVNMNDV